MGVVCMHTCHHRLRMNSTIIISCTYPTHACMNSSGETLVAADGPGLFRLGYSPWTVSPSSSSSSRSIAEPCPTSTRVSSFVLLLLRPPPARVSLYFCIYFATAKTKHSSYNNNSSVVPNFVRDTQQQGQPICK